MHPGYTLLAVKQPDVGANPCAARAYRLRKWSGIAGSALPSPTWGGTDLVPQADGLRLWERAWS